MRAWHRAISIIGDDGKSNFKLQLANDRSSWENRSLVTILPPEVRIFEMLLLTENVRNRHSAQSMRFTKDFSVIFLYIHSETDGTKIKIYNIYRTLLISFCSIHTFCELYMITFCVKELDIDELTVSIAYSIQHFLGIVKVYIM